MVVISSKAEAVVLFVVDEMVSVVDVCKFDEDVGEAVEEDVVAWDKLGEGKPNDQEGGSPAPCRR